MTSKADLEQTYFHNYQKKSRINNPTFNSQFMNNSLTLLTPHKKQVEAVLKQTEYKSNFEPFNDKVNTLSIYQKPHNYAKFSKQAFEKSNLSHLSQYGRNLITIKSEVVLNKK